MSKVWEWCKLLFSLPCLLVLCLRDYADGKLERGGEPLDSDPFETPPTCPRPLADKTDDELWDEWAACEQYINDPLDDNRLREAIDRQMLIEDEQARREIESTHARNRDTSS